MNLKDTEIRKAVSVVLIRACIDLSALNVYVVGGNVELRGTLKVLQHESQAGVTEADRQRTEQHLIFLIEQEIRRISGVRWIQMYLDNWEQVGGNWVRRKLKEPSR